MRYLSPISLSLALCLGWAHTTTLQAEESPAVDTTDTTTTTAATPATAATATENSSGMSLEEEGSYLIGVQMGMQALGSKEEMGLVPDLIIAGLQDAINEKKLRIANPQKRWGIVMPALTEKAKAHTASAGDANLAKGKAYMDGLRGKDGITFTDSGIAYEVLKKGDGSMPTAESTVKVNYRGMTIDGKEFDSSYKRGEPTEFPLKNVIPGWTEGIQLMPVGSKYRFHIPADLAYGEHGPASIGPNQVLIFEVELLAITK